MTSTLRSSDPPTIAEPDEIEQSAEQIAGSVIGMMRQFAGIKSRVGLGPEGDTSPLFLLVKLAHLGPRRASDLAEQLCADPSTVSRQVASLVKAGLIRRQADPDDGRACLLVPTELGIVTVGEYADRRAAAMAPLIRDWSAADRADFLRLIRKYVTSIDTHRDDVIATLIAHPKKDH